MEFFRIQRDIPFMRHALVLNVISFVTFALAVFFLATRGLHLSIEFTGGTVLEVEYAQPADGERARAGIDKLGLGVAHSSAGEVNVDQHATVVDPLADVVVGQLLRG